MARESDEEEEVGKGMYGSKEKGYLENDAPVVKRWEKWETRNVKALARIL